MKASRSCPLVLSSVLFLAVALSAAAESPLVAEGFDRAVIGHGWRTQRRHGWPAGRLVEGDAAAGEGCYRLRSGAIERTETVPAKPFHYYRIRFAARAAKKGQRAYWFVYFYDADGREITSDHYGGFYLDTAWQAYEYVFMARAGSVSMRLGFGCHADRSRPGLRRVPVDLDAVRLEHSSKEAALAWMDAFAEDLPPLKYEPAGDRHRFLPQTMRRLREGGELTVLMLGDSICNDTSNSMFQLLLERRYPGARVRLIHSQRGGTGCRYYQHARGFDRYVKPYEPDLLVIAGISHGRDVRAIRRVIRKARRQQPELEVLVMTGAVHEPGLSKDMMLRGVRDVPPKQRAAAMKEIEAFHQRLLAAGAEDAFAVFHMRRVYEDYIAAAPHDRHWFMRDLIHANARGKQVLGRILERYFQPAAEP